MKIGLAATGILIAAVAGAQTGVSGQPGVPTTGMMATVPDASSSPVVVNTPAQPVPSAPPRTSPPAHPAATPAPPVPPSPRAVGSAQPSAPAAAAAVAPVPASSEEPAKKPKKKEGADFYTPYLSASDTLDATILDLTARVAAKPGDAGLHNDLGNLLARRGFARQAIEQYREAAKVDPEFFLADYNEGLLLEKEGRDGDAISAYKRSIKRKPGFPLSRFHLGFLYEKKGHNDSAVAEYAKALRIDPSLRWPTRNPLVVQSRLLYRASLVNYERDLAAADLADEGEFADRAVWEKLQPQHPVNTSELESESEPEEAATVVGAPATGHPAVAAPIIGGKTSSAGPYDPRRPVRARPGRPNQPPSRTTVPVPPPPAAVEPPPADENAPNPAMEEPPPPPSAARLALEALDRLLPRPGGRLRRGSALAEPNRRA
jgi:hypothetical protein